MTVSFATDSFGRLTCSLKHEGASGIATASNRDAAARELMDALSSMESSGLGECFWPEACGQYRWLLRRTGGTATVAVMWSTGAVTGWEHVFWTECPVDQLSDQIRLGIAGFVTE